MLRLIDVVGNDHEHLRRYLGEHEFRAMASRYITANPSQHPNARWFSRGLPEFLRTTEPYAQKSVLGELAALERALNDAFDADDAPVLGISDLAAIPADAWSGLCFVAHPSAACLEASTNAGAIWMALKAGEEPPLRAVSPEAVRILVWRHGTDRDVSRALRRGGDDVAAYGRRRPFRRRMPDDGGLRQRGDRAFARGGHSQDVAGRGAAQPCGAAGRLSLDQCACGEVSPAGTTSGSVATAPPSRRCSLSSRR